MRLVVYGPGRRLGVLEGDQVVDVNGAYAKYLAEAQDEPFPYELAGVIVPGELGAFITSGERALEGVTRAVEHLTRRASDQTGLRGERLVEPIAGVKLHAPLARRVRLMMAGSNYPVHTQGAQRGAAGELKPLDEVKAEMRRIGIRGFFSFIENCVGTDADVVYPSRTDRLDYEGEIAVIIGKKGKDIKADRAKDHFWGYMLLNDISARTALPKPDNPGSRFARDKNFDSSCSAGPYVAVGELDDPQDIAWETKVNGDVRQRGTTKDMSFSFGELLEHLSEDMMFYPGDVISAGTTGGTAMDSAEILQDGKRDPKLFLKVGDLVEVSNPVLGVLRNRIVAKKG